MLKPYRELLRVPHLGPILFLSVLGRVHATGASLALTFLVVSWTDSYALAGLVIGALTLGNGVSGPWRGRLADRRSAPRLLTTTCLLYAAGMIAMLCLPGWAWPAAPVLALLIGLSTPPVGPVARAAYTRLADGNTRSAVFAAEATLFELAVMSGPLLAALTVGLAGPRAAVGLIAALALASVLSFAAALRRAGLGEPAPKAAGTAVTSGSVLAVPGLTPALVAAMLLMMGFSSVNLVIIAVGRELALPAVAGALVSVWAIGSMIGGLVAGGRSGTPRYVLRMALLTAGVAILVPALPPLSTASPMLIGTLLAIGGLAISPTVAAANQRIGELAPADRAAEAFGWLASFTTTGTALAAPFAGWLLDTVGPAAAAGGAAVAALIATLSALISTRRKP
ncbi:MULTISPECIES: MFS transporter [unclassified Crossiella]|uniref:MFS transporter n=1 Tax=unclassified Crossiella TaxID=2620835 RepID=UPI001FFEDB79|nr:MULTISPECIES: MFS transporter [unclassified Crossiella]MCK2237002.1 MFS transporter [Crossiella sp. S99.2]MCK2250670.1 MFS transporter [Crossiella sp. S99.1]